MKERSEQIFYARMSNHLLAPLPCMGDSEKTQNVDDQKSLDSKVTIWIRTTQESN